MFGSYGFYKIKPQCNFSKIERKLLNVSRNVGNAKKFVMDVSWRIS